jgi:hypothetical protein
LILRGVFLPGRDRSRAKNKKREVNDMSIETGLLIGLLAAIGALIVTGFMVWRYMPENYGERGGDK